MCLRCMKGFPQMKSKLISIFTSIFLLSACASFDVPEEQEIVEQNYIALESKHRTYPVHLHNGVIVEDTQTWHLGEGRSFESVEEIQKQPTIVQSWNLSDEEYDQYSNKDSDVVKLNVEIYKADPTKVIPETTFNETETDTLDVKDGENTQVTPTSSKTTSTKEKTADSTDVAPKKNDSLPAKNLAKEDTDQLHYSEVLPENLSQTFEFVKGTVALTDESRERIVYYAPQMLVYKKVAITSFFNNEEGRDFAIEKANVLKSELLRAGAKSDHISITTEEGDTVKAFMTASEKMTVSYRDIKVDSNTNVFEASALSEYLDAIKPDSADWIRIITGNTLKQPIEHAVRLKAALQAKGVDDSHITILHRQTDGSTVGTLIYSNGNEGKKDKIDAMKSSLPPVLNQKQNSLPELPDPPEGKVTPEYDGYKESKSTIQSKDASQVSFSSPVGTTHVEKLAYEHRTTILDNASQKLLEGIKEFAVQYSSITINTSFSKTGIARNAWTKADAIMDALIASGVKRDRIHFNIQKGNEDIATINFTGKYDVEVLTLNDKNELDTLTNIKNIEWIRILPGSKYNNSISESLTIKKSATTAGIDKRKITILERTSTTMNSQLIIYRTRQQESDEIQKIEEQNITISAAKYINFENVALTDTAPVDLEKPNKSFNKSHANNKLTKLSNENHKLFAHTLLIFNNATTRSAVSINSEQRRIG